MGFRISSLVLIFPPLNVFRITYVLGFHLKLKIDFLYKMDLLHTFYLRYNDRQFIIGKVDLDKYSYLDSFDDIDKCVLTCTFFGISYTYAVMWTWLMT